MTRPSRHFIELIKQHRTLHSSNLKEAKDAVEAGWTPEADLKKMEPKKGFFRWHWYNAEKTPQAPALWLGNVSWNKYSRRVRGIYGLEMGTAFFGIMKFY